MSTAQHCRDVRQFRRVLLAFGSALILSGWAIESAAEATDKPLEKTVVKTPEQRRAELLKEGADALRKGRPLEALRRWRAAWDIRRHYEIACDIGTAELLYGSSAEAATFLSICVREHPVSSPRERERREQSQTNLAKAREQVGRLMITVSQSGAEVRIDGHSVGLSPLSPLRALFIEPGVHRITADLDGYRRGEAVIDVAKGTEHTLSICLEKLSPSRGALPCPLASAAKPFPGADPARPLHPGGGASLPLVVAGGVLSGALAGLGTGLIVASSRAEVEGERYGAEVSRRDMYDCIPTETRAACAGYIRSDRERLDLTRGATASFITAGAVAAATVIYILHARSSPKPPLQQSGAMMVVHPW